MGFLETLEFVFLEENRWMYYVNGVKVTIIVAFLSGILGILLGLLAAIMKLTAERKGRRTLWSVIANIYIDIIRGTPSVLQLMIIYFVVFRSRMGYVAGVVSFGINSGAYVAEIIRAGIMAVDQGQTEAGRSLGLSYRKTMQLIIIPQAVKNILPALGNEFILLIKETSILGYVGIIDLTKAASYITSRTYKMFIPLIAAAIIYYLLIKLLSVALAVFERRLRESDRR
ncbi:MAG: amino acid ABC transporter permease [Candidatus Limivivens sp.]|nr:amino acid ABC transporter permease [Candidatus Limivivens sp.]